MMAATALVLHVLSAVVWVGGMFLVYVCLRPAIGALEPPERMPLMRSVFRTFFVWVWVSIVLLLGSGYWMVFAVFGGFATTPVYVHLMQGLGLVMIALFLWLFHGPWLAFKRATDAGDWAAAGRSLGRIRQIVAFNLPLGLLVVLIASGGRYVVWS